MSPACRTRPTMGRPANSESRDLNRRLEARAFSRTFSVLNSPRLALPTAQAKEALQVIPGVAEKVADCVLLFAYGRLEAFPVDTWIRKVMIRMYFGGRHVPDRAIRDFAQERWGDLAGYAQQYLYPWSRSHGRSYGRAPSRTL